MKFMLPLSLLAAAVSAQSTATGEPGESGCLADYIVQRCLETESPKAEACNQADYSCLCAAYEAISTCYNNCPNDLRAGPAKNQVRAYCAQASIMSSTMTSANATITSSATSTSSTANVITTTNSDGDVIHYTASISGDSPEETGSSSPTTGDSGAAELVGSMTGIFVAAAGAIAALL